MTVDFKTVKIPIRSADANDFSLKKTQKKFCVHRLCGHFFQEKSFTHSHCVSVFAVFKTSGVKMRDLFDFHALLEIAGRAYKKVYCFLELTCLKMLFVNSY